MAAREASCWRTQVQRCLVYSNQIPLPSIHGPLPLSIPALMHHGTEQTIYIESNPFSSKCCFPSLPIKHANVPALPATPSLALTCTLTSRRVRPISVMTGSTRKGRLMLS